MPQGLSLAGRAKDSGNVLEVYGAQLVLSKWYWCLVSLDTHLCWKCTLQHGASLCLSLPSQEADTVLPRIMVAGGWPAPTQSCFAWAEILAPEYLQIWSCPDS